MTENKKKTTKKEVVEKSEAPVKEVKKAKTKEKREKQVVATETLISDEVPTVITEELPEMENVTEVVKAEDYEFNPEEKKEKRSKKVQLNRKLSLKKKLKQKLNQELPLQLKILTGIHSRAKNSVIHPNIRSMNHFTMRRYLLLQLMKL